MESCFTFLGWIRQVVCWSPDQMCGATGAHSDNLQHCLLSCNFAEGRPRKLGTCSGNYIMCSLYFISECINNESDILVGADKLSFF
jgi:hypothetical protein